MAIAASIVAFVPSLVCGFVAPTLQPFVSTHTTNPERTPHTSSTCLSMSLVKACTTVNELVYSRKIVIFGISDDPHTLRVMNLFDEGHVQYTTIQLDVLENGADMMDAITHMTGRTQVPCIYIDGKFIGGHDHILAMNLDGHLGQLLDDIDAIPVDRLRDLKKSWRHPSVLNLSGTKDEAGLS